ARQLDIEGARAGWLALWRQGATSSGLAARLAWAELRSGSIAGAALWVLRGQRGEARDPALGWAWERVREGGGLTGATRGRLPVRSGEWCALALVLGILGGFMWRPRGPRAVWLRAGGLAALALAIAAVAPLEAWRVQRLAQAVVRSGVPLEDAGLELTPGPGVRGRGGEAGRLRGCGGPGIAGAGPAAA